MKKNIDYVAGISDTILAISIIILIILAVPLVVAQFREKPSDITEIIDLCSKMSLENATLCVKEETNSFYKYTAENIGRELTFKELIEEGGVCGNWSEYYTEIGNKLGYNAENILIKIENGIYHEFSVWSNKEEYCILDQTKTACFNFSTIE